MLIYEYRLVFLNGVGLKMEAYFLFRFISFFLGLVLFLQEKMAANGDVFRSYVRFNLTTSIL